MWNATPPAPGPGAGPAPAPTGAGDALAALGEPAVAMCPSSVKRDLAGPSVVGGLGGSKLSRLWARSCGSRAAGLASWLAAPYGKPFAPAQAGWCWPWCGGGSGGWAGWGG